MTDYNPLWHAFNFYRVGGSLLDVKEVGVAISRASHYWVVTKEHL